VVSYDNWYLYLLLAKFVDTRLPKNFQPAPVLVEIAPAVITSDTPMFSRFGFDVEMSREYP